MSVERAKTPDLGWDYNAQMFERRRVECLEQAERCERDGNADGAASFREFAEGWRQGRDRDQARYEMRIMNRRSPRRMH